MKRNINANRKTRLKATFWNGVLLVVLLIGGYITKNAYNAYISGQIGKIHPSFSYSNEFRLANIYHHGAGKHSNVHMVLDINDDIRKLASDHYQLNAASAEEPENDLWSSYADFQDTNPFNYSFKLKTTTAPVTRTSNRDPNFISSFLDYSLTNPEMAAKVEFEWEDEDVLAPDVTDRTTVMSLALMSSNAYVKLPQTGNWRNLTGWNITDEKGAPEYGWEEDGIRGHVFVNQNESVVVFAIKGTSSQILPGSGNDETSVNDKLNDNLLFSCCCARVTYLWTTVCDCYMKAYTCNEKCLENELRRRDYYYYAVMEMYKDIVMSYPNATIWLTGHSLGGALGSLLGRTFGLPAVTFQSPGEQLATKRLHLPQRPGIPSYKEAIWHFGHTADPIFMGTCNGASSACSIGGYAMETGCHTGKVCVYDVVADKGWHVSIMNHRIHTVIDNVILEYDTVPSCVDPGKCEDCYNWDFVRDEETASPKLSPSPEVTTTGYTGASPTKRCVGRNWIGICTSYEPVLSKI
ncbi:HHL078Cp [Eremothecium sinecaudum]|uniref:Putative lipase ATG15 n=1 Tax=Eremothecium sinecaudum TaxID=45286 RepID=A0A0X8HWD5_9SACH|nr:HHL078Cp [Eremothecium sinecaudum]AMD22692.1 HHL078Cp [Eremothecium sinecaudum]